LKELPTLRAKLKELESRDESGAKAVREEIESVKKRNAELEQEIRFVNFEKSKDYQEQFQKPYEDAWGSALRDLKGLTMSVEDPKTGEEVRREVTQADIAYFANLDPAVRRTEINRLFPEDKEEVKRHVNKLRDLADRALEAKEKARTEADTHAKTQTESQRIAQIERAKLWKKTNDELAAKYPKAFGKDDADSEGNAVFDKGSAFADLVFAPTDLTPERVELLPQLFKDAVQSAKPFSQEMWVRVHAIARNKLANYSRLAYRNKSLSARVSELEKSLKEYEESGPDRITVGARRRDKDAPLSAEEEFDALARGN
jgi:ABC-type transporter MlaC component